MGPMSLVTYAEARPHARAIRDKVVARTMPPWHADTWDEMMAGYFVYTIEVDRPLRPTAPASSNRSSPAQS